MTEAWASLTPIQRQVLWLRAQGLSRQEIADIRFVSVSTIRNCINATLGRIPPPDHGCQSRNKMHWVAYQIGKYGLEP